jgi:hypothetical protein
MKNPEIQLPSVCSVRQMADHLRLSRERFYQLQKAGVFPPPVYDIATKRPFYPLDLQQICLQIRKTGVGFNGQAVLFNTPRNRSKPRDHSNPQIIQYVQALKGVGCITNAKKVRAAISVIYPNGLNGKQDGIIIRHLARYLAHGTMPDVQSP